MTSTLRWLPHRPQHFVPDAASPPAFEPADFAPALKTRLLILQPTPFCNIACDYCYLPDRESTARMSLATVRAAARRLRDDGLLGEQLTVVWHAGEPLAVPVAFYADAIPAIAEEMGACCEVSHAIQTNATLIDDAWCELFQAHAVRIGVSVDGPAELHDRHRRTRTGKGTFEQVLRGMERLRAHGIAFHAIAVVTEATFARADAFFDFFEQHGVQDVGCNFDEAEGPHLQSSLAGHEAAHAAFVERLLDRSIASSAGVRVRELDTALRLIREPLPVWRWRGEAFPDNAQTMPFALVSVAHNGDFSSFSPELLGQPSVPFRNFILGNVARDGYFAAARTERFARLWQAIMNGTRACERNCSHFDFCGGGAPANKLYENGDLASAETLYCRTMVKRPFDAVLRRLEQDRPAKAQSLAAAGAGVRGR
jgi:uncharacterized protein